MINHRYVHGAAVDERLVHWQYDTATGAESGAQYYHRDHQGSIIALSDAGGNLVEDERYSYDAYGNQPEGEGTGQPFRYTGRRWDDETGLYYYRARYYSAKLGRFLQTDPIGYEDNMNLYGYTGNDPVNNTDPMGEEKITVSQTVWAGLIYAQSRTTNETTQYSDATGQPIAKAISRTVGHGIGYGAGASEDVSYCSSCEIMDVSGGDSLSLQIDAIIAGGGVSLNDSADPTQDNGLKSKKVEGSFGTGPGVGLSLTLDRTETLQVLFYDFEQEKWVDVTQQVALPPEEEQ